MPAPLTDDRPLQRPWLAAVLALGVLGIACLPEAVLQAASLQPALGVSAHWLTGWTAHTVHWGWPHAAANALGLLMTTAAAEQVWPRRSIAAALALGAPCVAAGIVWLEPTLPAYRGASGLVLLLATLAWVGWWRLRRIGRTWLLAWAGAGLAKLAWEVWGGCRGVPQTGLGLPAAVHLAWSAHLCGAVVGLVAGGLLGVVYRNRR